MMFSAPLTIRQHGRERRPITLAWPQFVALAAGLCTVAVVVAIILVHDISEALYRLEVRQYEQELGFELGRIKGLPGQPKEGWWGIGRVTPGGTMDRAGMQSGDLVSTRHGYPFAALRWAISESANGRTACLVVINAKEYPTTAGREVCLKGPIGAQEP